ncbi:GAF domain-containing sensor histidine kinase [Salinimonas chungwhensis]|uniref:GAF domain-containing sensor histidine kinase n=1 Tax=Salinimonas chungwhensis TaxID=265425 RepID=UPI00037CDB15|nr:HAMP domain-containing sensor histidine kinase [Salinimonas chungwhensis]
MAVDKDLQTIQSIDAVPHIMSMLADTTGLRFICVARVTESYWKSCAVLDKVSFDLKPGDELDIKATFCDRVRSTAKPIIIEQASTDGTYSRSDIPLMYGFESYFSYPIYDHNNNFFGTICGLDPLPKKLNTPFIKGQIAAFAELISRQLEAEEALTNTQSDLSYEQTASKLREQYIAILGHDLRTPLSSVSMGIDYLKGNVTDETSQKVLTKMDKSTKRMTRLISDVMDFTHGKMGNGIPLKLSSVEDLGSALLWTVNELVDLHPECDVQADIEIAGTFNCDQDRISQLLSNLLINAIVHGDHKQPIYVKGRTNKDELELSVSNGGQPIPPETQERLFQPFWREQSSSHSQGLGLGLFIASQIAEAHDGELRVDSNTQQTIFTFKAIL